MKDYKDRCADCVCLIWDKERWFCDEAQMPCKYVEECPEGIHQCTWCKEYFCDYELHKEINLGYLCTHCIVAIQSRGEHLTIEI